jgi:nicotinate-nucleotide adenylyltransferase
MRQHIGLLMGSFNPIHIGHLALANYMRVTCDMDQVWLVVSPQNPFKDETLLIDSSHRLKMVEIALNDQPDYKVCDIELTMPVPSYTIHTLDKLSELYPDKSFSLIMGSDNVLSINRWKDYERILQNHHLYIYPRPNAEMDMNKINHVHIRITHAPLLDISSTFIREQLKQGHDMRFFLPLGVSEYINKNHLYQNK